jgi:hypothetical protein
MDSPEMVKEMVYNLLKKKAEKQVTQVLDGEESPQHSPPSKNDIDQFWWF